MRELEAIQQMVNQSQEAAAHDPASHEHHLAQMLAAQQHEMAQEASPGTDPVLTALRSVRMAYAASQAEAAELRRANQAATDRINELQAMMSGTAMPNNPFDPSGQGNMDANIAELLQQNNALKASNQELEAVVAAHRDTIQQCNTTFVEALRDLLNVADAQQVQGPLRDSLVKWLHNFTASEIKFREENAQQMQQQQALHEQQMQQQQQYHQQMQQQGVMPTHDQQGMPIHDPQTLAAIQQAQAAAMQAGQPEAYHAMHTGEPMQAGEQMQPKVEAAQDVNGQQQQQ
jgi:hypothetical protein